MKHDDLNSTVAKKNELKRTALEKALKDNQSLSNKIWLGAKKSPPHKALASLDSGYDVLNEQLHSNGWPLSTTTELGFSEHGIGELRLLIPALRELQKNTQQQNIIWIAPPFLPYAPSLLKEEIDTDKLTIVQTNTVQDTLWAAEQALIAECCAAVFCWTGTYNLNNHQLRRLQLASEKTHSWNILFRHSDCLKQASASGLRIHLKSNSHSKLDLHILKQPNGWGGQHCSLSLHPHYENWQRLPAHLLPQHNQVKARALPEQLKTLNGSDHQQATVTVLTAMSALKNVH